MRATNLENNKEIQSQIHAGRRGKLRARFVKDGLTTFNECEVIEFALGFCIPRIDTNPIAHRLINKFGGLAGVIDAKPSDLSSVTGIGGSAAVFLAFLKQFTTYTAALTAKQVKIDSPEKAAAYLMPLMQTYSVEQLAVLCLDKAGRVLIIDCVTSNELDKVRLNIRDIVQTALRVRTASVILSHNHLDENPSPSSADISLTRQLTSVFASLNIDLADHVIFAGDKHYSFATSGMTAAFKREYAREHL